MCFIFFPYTYLFVCLLFSPCCKQVNVFISVKNALIDLVTLTFQPPNHVNSGIFQCDSLYQVWTLWDNSFLSYAADKQTDKQTEAFGRPGLDSGYTSEVNILPMATEGCYCRVLSANQIHYWWLVSTSLGGWLHNHVATDRCSKAFAKWIRWLGLVSCALFVNCNLSIYGYAQHNLNHVLSSIIDVKVFFYFLHVTNAHRPFVTCHVEWRLLGLIKLTFTICLFWCALVKVCFIINESKCNLSCSQNCLLKWFT